MVKFVLTALLLLNVASQPIFSQEQSELSPSLSGNLVSRNYEQVGADFINGSEASIVQINNPVQIKPKRIINHKRYQKRFVNLRNLLPQDNFDKEEIKLSEERLIMSEPQQEAVENARSWNVGIDKITPLATFRVKARVLSVIWYTHDRESEIAPVDLALGWKHLSHPRIFSYLSFNHGDREFYWQSDNLPFPVTDAEFRRESSNMHIIPANDEIKTRLKQVRAGDVISFQGYLVQVAGSDGFVWQTSLTRNDNGEGASEVVWVENLSVLR